LELTAAAVLSSSLVRLSSWPAGRMHPGRWPLDGHDGHLLAVGPFRPLCGRSGSSPRALAMHKYDLAALCAAVVGIAYRAKSS
jgi:hypothetical protein